MKNSEIAEYVIDNYPDCCMASNNEVKVGCREEWYEDYLIDPLMDFFTFELLDDCGCGSPESTNEAIRKILLVQQFLHSKSDENWNTYYDKYLDYKKEIFGSDYKEDFKYGLIQFMMYQLDNKDILEHGSGIGGAWLTNLGEMFLSVLNSWHERGY